MTQQPSTQENQPRTKKVDITSKIVGKLQDQQVLLYAGDRHIGTIPLPNEEFSSEFEAGFGMEAGKIYQKQTEGVEDDQYVEGCDMGWC